ncbi:MAG TPA: hypothetical protein VK737_02795, partial [Opitutales bacterium]|nr:hypothetical protein [Opitutales bacterium]
MKTTEPSSPPVLSANFRWLSTGEEAMREMLLAIENARSSIRLEVYIFQPGALGEQFRTALIAAAQRKVR